MQVILSGLAMGSIYALAALSLVLVYRAVNLVNFAQGDLAMLGAFFGVVAYGWFQLPVWAAMLVALGANLAFGLVVEFCTYRFLEDRSFLPFVVTTIALGLILQNTTGILTKFEPLAFPAFFRAEAVSLLGARLSPQHLFIVAITLVLLLALRWFFNRTRLGVLLQASAQDPDAARLSGVNVGAMTVVTFCLSSLLSGLAGLLLAPIFFVTSSMGSSVILKAFAATIMGGFGSETGAIAGGLLLGLIEILAARFVSSAYSEAITFGILIVFLLVLPQGLLGEKISERV